MCLLRPYARGAASATLVARLVVGRLRNGLGGPHVGLEVAHGVAQRTLRVEPLRASGCHEREQRATELALSESESGEGFPALAM